MVEDLQFAVEGCDKLLIRLDPDDHLGKQVVPGYDIDPATLRNVELSLQLRPEALVDLPENPVCDLGMRQRGLDFQQPVIADEPIGTASHGVIVVGDEADLYEGLGVKRDVVLARAA